MNRDQKSKQKCGFTFIELLVVVTLIGVLMAVGVVSYVGTSAKSRDAKRKADLELIRGALELYKAEEGTYPLNNCLQVGSIDEYLSGEEVPTDPKGAGWQPYICQSDGSSYCLRACFERESGSGSCSGLGSCTTGQTYKVTNP